MLRSAVIVAVPEAAGAVDRWREQTCNDRPSIGVPAHITLVFPFVPAGRLDQEVIASLAEIFGAETGFDFELRRPARFPKILYLAPEPASAFTRLTDAVVSRFPGYPPYEGTFDTVIPHLTVAQGDDAMLDDVEADVRRYLPIRAEVREAVLLEEVLPDWGRWAVRSRLPLAAVA